MKKIKVLVVDDSETQRITVGAILEEQGFHVVEALTGVDGLRVVEENPDLMMIVADYNMPDMDGLEMSRNIKESFSTLKIPIVILSIEYTGELRALAKEVGVVAWMTKPVAKGDLIRVVEKVAQMTSKVG